MARRRGDHKPKAGRPKRVLAGTAMLWRASAGVRICSILSTLEPVWDELYPAEQARILRLLIKRIDVAPDGISVTLHAAGIRSLVAELADQEAPALAASEPLLEPAE
jgi:hypothetical protein